MSNDMWIRIAVGLICSAFGMWMAHMMKRQPHSMAGFVIGCGFMSIFTWMEQTVSWFPKDGLLEIPHIKLWSGIVAIIGGIVAMLILNRRQEE